MNIINCTPVTKAFRLLWHFCHAHSGIVSTWADESQKPFGFFGISAAGTTRDYARRGL